MGREKHGSGRQVAELALQLGRAVYGDSATGGLTAAQWMALRFFARANRFSRTISAFAEFHATTRGTASQTVKSLVQRGYLTRSPSERDGRSARFDLTAKSRRTLDADPFAAVIRAACGLSAADRERTAEGLRQLLGKLMVERERLAPGTCTRCGHLSAGDKRGFRCSLLSEPLAASELGQLCVHYDDCRGRPAARSGSGRER